MTWSAHWIAIAPLRRAIGAYLEREGGAIDAYASEADAHAPFRKGEPTATAMITWLAPDDPPDRFPPHEAALSDPSGLLAAGGDLRPERLIAAYARGIFPWYSPGQPVLWWSPDPREVLWPQEFRRVAQPACERSGSAASAGTKIAISPRS